MRGCSHNLRTHVLRAAYKGVPTLEVARIFSIRVRRIERYQQRRETGDIQPRPMPGGRRLIDADYDAALWVQLPSTVPSGKSIMGVIVRIATISRRIH